MTSRVVAITLTVGGLAGCAVGPNYNLRDAVARVEAVWRGQAVNRERVARSRFTIHGLTPAFFATPLHTHTTP